MPQEQLLVNLGLYIRSSVLAKVLYVDELYRRITRVPGVIMEFGTWWGANLALFESLRAIHEPYNYTRKIIGFDTFKGYASLDRRDKDHDAVRLGGYSVKEGYVKYLEKVLDYHENENPMSHIKKYELVQGDVVSTIVQYMKKNTETIVALAYFDLGLYRPTKKCLEVIKPHLARGSVIAMDQLNCKEFPGETLAFKEVFGLNRYRLIRSRFLPDRTYLIVE